MGKLKSRLHRRSGQQTEDPLTVKTPDEKQHPPILQNESKSDIIAQLKKRMEKVSAKHALNNSIATPKSTDALCATETIQSKPVFPLSESSIEKNGERFLPGEVCDTLMGEVWINRETYPSEHRHGNEPLNSFLMTGKGLAVLAKDQRLETVNPQNALFIDTETTGLSGGTGTLPFLIGVGWFEPDSQFYVEHIFCREPQEEAAQLDRLSMHLERAEYLVTFNGKAYDLPLINTRFIMNRTPNPAYGIPHLDLLHISRRIFKSRLKDRSLGNLENAVLGFWRHDDIPGHAIPAAYADYLRGGPCAPIVSILEHNSMDLLALAALGGVLERMYTDPNAVEHAADHLGLAKAGYMAGEQDRADSHLAMAGQFGQGENKREALHLAAKHAYKRKDFLQAKSTWEKLISLYPDDPYAHLSLTKYYEHKEKNYSKALHHAMRALDAEGDDANSHRRHRIERKQAKQNGN